MGNTSLLLYHIYSKQVWCQTSKWRTSPGILWIKNLSVAHHWVWLLSQGLSYPKWGTLYFPSVSSSTCSL